MAETQRAGVRVGTLRELRERGCVVVAGEHGPIAVFAHERGVHAVDNRCPHMGFPLHRGSVADGILTCHWHHARFDLSSGCTFDLFADDVPTYPVSVEGGEVWVLPYRDAGGEPERQQRRLVEGLEQNISLVIAKAVIALLHLGVPFAEVAGIGIRFGARNRAAGWSPGLTILTAMANLCPALPAEEQALALYQGLLHVARDSANQPPRRELLPLRTRELDLPTLKRWFRRFVEVRDEEGAERTLLTAIAIGAPPDSVADLMVAAATDHFFLDGGHTLDFLNKAFEALELTGWENAAELLPTLVGQLCRARRSEETQSWRHPVDLVPLLHSAFGAVEAALAARASRNGDGVATTPANLSSGSLIEALLGESPEASVAALVGAIGDGAPLAALGSALCSAAALRICRFGTQNEFGDWITVLHTFTYCNALQRALERALSPELARGLFHGAMRVYLDRFLNIPPARLPDGSQAEAPAGEELQGRLLELLDGRHAVEPAAQLVSGAAQSSGRGGTTRALAAALLREDAEFHTFQMVEAAVRQAATGEGPETTWPLVAAARYLAAHSPTDRARLQTFRIAQRLHRGDALYEGPEA